MSMKKIWIAITMIISIAVIGAVYFIWPRTQTKEPISQTIPSTIHSISSTPTIDQMSTSPTTLASQAVSPSPSPTLEAEAIIANVPFIQQAPLKNWDAFHEETCEEAAVLAVTHYLKGDNSVPVSTQEAELSQIADWEVSRFGSYEDETAAQAAEILSDYFSFGSRVKTINLTGVDDIKREIMAGRPVMVPTAGKLLKNPHFKSPGPIYHMTVITGYTKDGFITNDPGTQYGQNYIYPINTLWNAIHDFVDRTDTGMETGAKVGIVVN